MCSILLVSILQALILCPVNLGYLSKIYFKNQALDDREGGKAFPWPRVGNFKAFHHQQVVFWVQEQSTVMKNE